MPGVTLRLTQPRAQDLAPDAAERALRALYAQPEGTIRLSMIAAADGRAAGSDGSSRSINGEADLRILRTVRSLADAVLVGARTALTEGYGDIRLGADLAAQRAAAGQERLPDLAIVTWSGRIPARLDPERTWIVTTAGSPATRANPVGDPGRILIAGRDGIEAATLKAELARVGLSRVVCEGGPDVAARLLAIGAVDDFCLTTSPLLGGTDQPLTPSAPSGWALAHRLEAEGFTMERWLRR